MTTNTALTAGFVRELREAAIKHLRNMNTGKFSVDSEKILNEHIEQFKRFVDQYPNETWVAIAYNKFNEDLYNLYTIRANNNVPFTAETRKEVEHASMQMFINLDRFKRFVNTIL